MGIGQAIGRHYDRKGGLISGTIARKLRGDIGYVERALEQAGEHRMRCVAVEPGAYGTQTIVLSLRAGADISTVKARGDLIAGFLGHDRVYGIKRRGGHVLLTIGPDRDFPSEREEYATVDGVDADLRVTHHEPGRDAVAELTSAYPRVVDSVPDYVQLFTTAGLAVKRVTKEPNPDGSACTVTTWTVPGFTHLHIAPTGLMVALKGVPGQTLSTYKAALPHLITAWNAPKLSVSEPEGGTFLMSFNDVDPFDRDFTLDGPTRYDADKGVAELGISASGQPVELHFKGNSGAVVGGIVGSGKTASLMPVWAGMAGQAEFHVFDGKEGNDMAPLRHISRTYSSSDDLDAPLLALQRLDETRKLRMAAQYALTGESNFWNLSAQQREALGLYLIVVILDECQTWLDTDGLSKEDKAKAEAIIRLVRTLIQKARSAGICVVLTTQKPDNTSMPTKIRDNCAIKICYAMETAAAAGTVLGTVSEGDPSPTEFNSPGRCAVKRRGRGSDETQSFYIPIQRLEAILSRWNPVPDQQQVAVTLAQRAGLDFATATAPDDDEPAPKAKAPNAEPEPEVVEPAEEPETVETQPEVIEPPAASPTTTTPEPAVTVAEETDDPFAGL